MENFDHAWITDGGQEIFDITTLYQTNHIPGDFQLRGHMIVTMLDAREDPLIEASRASAENIANGTQQPSRPILAFMSGFPRLFSEACTSAVSGVWHNPEFNGSDGGQMMRQAISDYIRNPSMMTRFPIQDILRDSLMVTDTEKLVGLVQCELVKYFEQANNSGNGDTYMIFVRPQTDTNMHAPGTIYGKIGNSGTRYLSPEMVRGTTIMRVRNLGIGDKAKTLTAHLLLWGFWYRADHIFKLQERARQ